MCSSDLWILGLIAGAGCLAALVPASAQILAAASLLSRNLFPTNEEQLTQRTRLWIVVLAVLAFGLWYYNRVTLVGLLLIGYSGVTQLFPGVVLSLRKQPPHPWSVAIGIIVALVLLSLFALQGTSVIYGANVGTFALAVNFVCLFVIDYFIGARRRKPSPER